MQIRELVLYSYDGRKRAINFRLGEVNIITGSSKTGKSALVDIIEFCLGRGSCDVPAGVIRERVAAFGIVLDMEPGCTFIARANPDAHLSALNAVYIEHGDSIASPDQFPTPNTTTDALRDALTRRVGISPNLHVPPAGQTRAPLEANIRHSLLYCFQQQHEIANPSILFHRQSEYWVEQAIKDTLPYFLGAIREDQLALDQELERAEQEVKRAERALREARAVADEGSDAAVSLLAEARQVGLIAADDTPEQIEGIMALFLQIKDWTPEAVSFDGSDRLSHLQDEVYELQRQLDEKADAIRAARTFAQEATGYESEVQQQQWRLESIGLFDATANGSACPLCSHDLAREIPNAEAIRHSIEQLRSNLEATQRERPRLREYIQSLENERDGIRTQIHRANQAIASVLREEEHARRLRDLNVRRAHVAGRISFWLEGVNRADDLSAYEERVSKAQELVNMLQAQIEAEQREDRLASILNRIGNQMSAWAANMQLEHSENPVRLDLRQATVVIDRIDNPIPLRRMGSGENWVGYHLITHLALHKHFRQHSRPVPGFLFLDQPSQAYYPQDQDAELMGSLDAVSDDDRRAVQQMYSLVFDVVGELAPGFQVIITDHADLADSQFRSAVVERWRHGIALVPDDWQPKETEDTSE